MMDFLLRSVIEIAVELARIWNVGKISPTDETDDQIGKWKYRRWR